MRKFKLEIDETTFNLLWRSLCDREEKLLKVIEGNDEESDEALVANNDIIYLRATKNALKQYAKEAGFRDEAFETSEEIIDLSKL